MPSLADSTVQLSAEDLITVNFPAGSPVERTIQLSAEDLVVIDGPATPEVLVPPQIARPPRRAALLAAVGSLLGASRSAALRCGDFLCWLAATSWYGLGQGAAAVRRRAEPALRAAGRGLAASLQACGRAAVDLGRLLGRGLQALADACFPLLDWARLWLQGMRRGGGRARLRARPADGVLVEAVQRALAAYSSGAPHAAQLQLVELEDGKLAIVVPGCQDGVDDVRKPRTATDPTVTGRPLVHSTP